LSFEKTVDTVWDVSGWTNKPFCPLLRVRWRQRRSENASCYGVDEGTNADYASTVTSISFPGLFGELNGRFSSPLDADENMKVEDFPAVILGC
jgi:hypothetical protein